MSTEEISFTLLMPTLNEIEGLRHVLPKIDHSLFKEIIVVDGKSDDGTVEYCREQGLKVLFQPRRGLPDAYEYAFSNITTDAIIIFTPDGNSLPELLPKLCVKLREGYDMVIASRYREGARSDDDDFMTAIGNRIFTFIVNFLFKFHYTDVLVGLRAYRREAIERMKLAGLSKENWLRRNFWRMNSWELGASIRAARLKLRIAEIPGDEPKRIGGQRKLSIFKNGLGAIFQIINDFFFFQAHSKP